MRYIFISLIVVVTFTVAAEQVLPESLHCLPVLIKIPQQTPNTFSYGTGIYVCDSNYVFLVTAAHCIFNMYSTNRSELINSNATLSAYGIGTNANKKNVYEIDLNKLSRRGWVKRHPTHDVAVVAVFKLTPAGPDGKQYDTYFPDEVRSICTNGAFVRFNVEGISITFKDVQDGSDTYILGYPIELLNNHIQPQIDYSYPLIRKGIVSQKNRSAGTLIIDSGVYGGNSGGPVVVVEHPSFNITTFKVAGLITQFVPVFTRVAPQIGVTNNSLVNSGYGVAEPIDYALELMQQF